MMIRAIETTYKGYRFRSRLEARWAVFFDTLGITWEYEKEGYVTSAGPYLPDFWLPDFRLFVEIKGQKPTEVEVEKVRALAEVGCCGRADWRAAIFWGLPGEHFGTLWDDDYTDGSGGFMQEGWACTFTVQSGFGPILLAQGGRESRGWQGPKTANSASLEWQMTGRIWELEHDAANAARTARFEGTARSRDVEPKDISLAELETKLETWLAKTPH